MAILSKQKQYDDWIGLSRNSCSNKCQQLGLHTIGFAHWLAIPNQNMMLVFKHQRCVAINPCMLHG